MRPARILEKSASAGGGFVRVLHTSDWHVGKRLGSRHRREEMTSALGELVDLVEDRGVDAVLVAGDLFDVKSPSAEAFGTVLEGLISLTLGGRVPVVAIAGNHDSGELIDNLAGAMEAHNVHLVGSVRPPEREWLVLSNGTPTVVVKGANGEIASVGAFPFVRETQIFHAFDIRSGREKGTYAERMRDLCAEYSEAAIREAERRDGKSFLMGHFLISGSKVLGRGMPRGEFELHMRDAYATTQQTVDTGVNYVAMGHVHMPQKLPGVHAPGAYAGSLLQADFGERGEEKRVIICDTETDPVTISSIPVISGRLLSKVETHWGEPIEEGVEDHYVDVTVTHCEDVSATEVREWAVKHFPYLVRVRCKMRGSDSEDDRPDASSSEPDGAEQGGEGVSVTDKWSEYHQENTGSPPPDKWTDTVRRLETEALA